MEIREFWESKQKLAINCKTLEEAKKIFEYAIVKTKRNLEFEWNIHKENTCFTNYGTLSSKEYLEKRRFKILNFEDILFAWVPKVGDRVEFKSWKEMKEEFGLKNVYDGYPGDIACEFTFTQDMKRLCGKRGTITDINSVIKPTIKMWIKTDIPESRGYSISKDMLKPLF